VIRRAAHTGGAGDGNVFTSTVDEALKIRSGERNLDAL
jgi:nitrogen regulatory protein PII